MIEEPGGNIMRKRLENTGQKKGRDKKNVGGKRVEKK